MFGDVLDLFFEAYVLAEDLGVDELGISGVVVEGGDAEEEFVGEDAEGPEVDGGGVALFEEDLGGLVLAGATEGEGLLLLRDQLPTKPEVSQLHVPTLLQQDVLRLQVPVNDSGFMSVMKCIANLDTQFRGAARGNTVDCQPFP